MVFSVSAGGPGGYIENDAHGDTRRYSGMDPLDAAYLIAQHYQGGVAQLAREMQVNAGTLQHKLNPNNDRFHLTLRDAMLLQRVSNSRGILFAWAAQEGYTVQRASTAAGAVDLVDVLVHLQLKQADLTHAIGDAVTEARDRRGQVGAAAQRRVDYAVQEVIAAANQMAAAIAARVPLRDAGL